MLRPCHADFPIISTPVHDALPGEGGVPDDLLRLKGIGPKLAALLNQHGITRFEHLASLTPDQVETLDQNFGAFRGRLARDHVIDQAGYLARGDTDGFEQRFGTLSSECQQSSLRSISVTGEFLPKPGRSRTSLRAGRREHPLEAQSLIIETPCAASAHCHIHQHASLFRDRESRVVSFLDCRWKVVPAQGGRHDKVGHLIDRL